MGVLEDLQRRLNRLEAWKVAVYAARTPRERQRTPPTSPSCAPPAATPPRKSTASTVSPRARKTRFRRRQASPPSAGSEAQAPSAAQALIDSGDLLALVLQHLDLPQLLLAKPVCRAVAQAARRIVCAPSWLRAASCTNLGALRRTFAARSTGFRLPMRVCLERFDWTSACWRRSYGTLRALTAELVPQSLRQFDDDSEACSCRVRHIRFELDGEGSFEETSRLFRGGSGLGPRYDCNGWVPTRAHAAGNDLHDERYDVLEDADGLGLLRPVAMEASCAAAGEPPLLGCRLSELVHNSGLTGARGESVVWCFRKRPRLS